MEKITQDNEPLRPIDIQLGNIIESMGKVELVTGIMEVGEGQFKIGHTGWHAKSSIFPDDVTYSTYPIPLIDEWKKCLGIDKYQLPEWIKYVHETQNYFMWALRVNLLDVMNWDILPKVEMYRKP
jgi:hypothetical protein